MALRSKKDKGEKPVENASKTNVITNVQISSGQVFSAKVSGGFAIVSTGRVFQRIAIDPTKPVNISVTQ